MEKDSEERDMYLSINFRVSDKRIFIKTKKEAAYVTYGSFVEVITPDMCRTSQSVPHKGYTSVSRIAKG